jgi:hypothetical protein
MRSSQAKAASAIDTDQHENLRGSIIRRLSKLSASAPASSANITIGSDIEVCTSVTISDGLRDRQHQPRGADDLNQPPNCEARLAIQTLRKMECRNGDNADERGLSSGIT